MMMLTFKLTSLAVAAILGLAVRPAHSFEVSSPSVDSYWVTNTTNILNWKANSTDPEYFSVQLLNQNSSSLNGNFQIGNALTTVNGTSQIYLDAIPTGTYSILFVNSSNYELDHPQVYYTSGLFELKPNGTTKADVKPNTDAIADSASSSSSPTSSTGQNSGNSSDQNNSTGSNASATSNDSGHSPQVSVWVSLSCLLVASRALI